MELLGGTLAGMMFLSGCSPTTEIIATETAMAATETPYVKYTATVEGTPTVEVTATSESTEIVEAKLIEWENIMIDINGKPVDFVIGQEEGSDVTNKWGIKGIIVNKDIVDYQEKLSIVLTSSLWQAYVNQSYSDISYDEFLKNPDKYPISLTSPDGNGGYKSESFTIDQIKKFEWRFVSRNDKRLYFTDPTVDSADINGYGISEDGTLTLYDAWPEINSSFDIIFADGLFAKIYNMSNTRELESPEGLASHLEKWKEAIGILHKTCSFLPSAEEWTQTTGGNSLESWRKYLLDHPFWDLVLK